MHIGYIVTIELGRHNALAAQSLRCADLFGDYQAFQEEFAFQNGQDFASLALDLYSDLPEFRQIIGYQPLEASELVSRYNLSQIQGLLIYCQTMVLQLDEPDVGRRRQFFNWLKFHRLLADVKENTSSRLRLEINGPLAVLDGARTYGLHIARFFPGLFSFENWLLEATVELPRRRGQAKLTVHPGSVEVLPTKAHLGYIPPEFSQIVSDFAELKSDGWCLVEDGEALINLGNQVYCLPDISLQDPQAKIWHIEFFHRFHQGALAARVAALAKKPHDRLLLGVSRELARKPGIKDLLAQSPWFSAQGFFFSQFPTAKGILQAIARLG